MGKGFKPSFWYDGLGDRCNPRIEDRCAQGGGCWARWHGDGKGFMNQGDDRYLKTSNAWNYSEGGSC